MKFLHGDDTDKRYTVHTTIGLILRIFDQIKSG